MRWSKYFIPTLKENPADAEIPSHQLMVRAGLMRKVGAGIYNYLPLGYRVIRKVEQIVREEMDRAGALELFMPVLTPSELWKESGRWDVYGKELMRLTDRHEREFALGPTHEEIITDIVRNEVRSYRQLPITLYQIQTKFRDEIRPRFGVIRAREFIMKDAYSFHEDEASLNQYYEVMYETYSRIFGRCGLMFQPVIADSGAIGGDVTHEFIVFAENGESIVLTCSNNQCGYTATIERAESRVENPDEAQQHDLIEVHTPGLKTVAEISKFLNVTPRKIIKTIIYTIHNELVALLVRGDREIVEAKVKRIFKTDSIMLPDNDTVSRIAGVDLGFLGPVNLKGVKKIIADHSIRGMKNAVTGANKNDYHFTGVNPGRDFTIERFEDVGSAMPGDTCSQCGSPLTEKIGIEVGQIFKLGTKYSQAMEATFAPRTGEEKLYIMGCYGIGVSRIVAAVIEQHHDKDGIRWPLSVAPFHVLVVPLNCNDEKIVTVAEQIYQALLEEGIEALLDDRDERPGFKLKDADLIGIPLQVVIGPKKIGTGVVEIKVRGEEAAAEIPVKKAVRKIQEILEGLGKPEYKE